MHIANLTDENIAVFQGLTVPAHGTLPVAVEMQHAVETSPLIAEYVKAKMLQIVKAEAPPVVEEAPKVVPPKVIKAEEG